MTGPLLNIRDLHKSYHSAGEHITVLDGIDIALDSGQSLALTGESGSGKSTLLHLIAALDVPDTGRIELGGNDVTGLDERARARYRREQIGIVFQQFNLIPSLNVRQNLAFQARLRGIAPDLNNMIEALGLRAHLDKYPEQLSGGQQQRVAIGRALAGAPSLLLADEPTGNLDEDTAASVLSVMLDLVRDQNMALLMVTHSQSAAAQLDRRAHLKRGRLTI